MSGSWSDTAEAAALRKLRGMIDACDEYAVVFQSRGFSSKMQPEAHSSYLRADVRRAFNEVETLLEARHYEAKP